MTLSSLVADFPLEQPLTKEEEAKMAMVQAWDEDNMSVVCHQGT